MKFEAGEMAMVREDCTTDREDSFGKYRGEIIEVVSAEIPSAGFVDGVYHKCRHADGKILYICPSGLRKLPPKDDLTTWDDIHKICGYRPREPVTIDAMLNNLKKAYEEFKPFP